MTLLAGAAGCTSSYTVVASGTSDVGTSTCSDGTACCSQISGAAAAGEANLIDLAAEIVPDLQVPVEQLDFTRETAVLLWSASCPGGSVELLPSRGQIQDDTFRVRVRVKQGNRGSEVEVRPYALLGVASPDLVDVVID